MSQATSTLLDQRRPSPLKALPTPVLALAGLLALVHLPLLIGHGQALWLREHYQLFPLVLIFHALSGVVVEAAGRHFEVEKACSGISSLLSIIACAAFYVLWAKTHWVRGTLLLLAAVFWVMVNNVTRVVLIVYWNTHRDW